MLVVVAALLSVSSLLALGNRKTTADTVIAAQAQYIAEAAVEVALKRVYWDPYTEWFKSTDKTKTTASGAPVEFDTCTFKKWLSGYGSSATLAQHTSNNSVECPYALFTASVTGNPLPSLGNNARITITSGDTGTPTLDNSKYIINVERRDDVGGTVNLLMDVTGQVLDANNKVVSERRLSRTLQISGEPYEGDKFAMLSTAANCSFCHLQIDTVQRAFSTSGTFERARVGFTEVNVPDASLDFSEARRPDVVIYGGMYVRAGLDKLTRNPNRNSTPIAAGDWARYTAQSNGFVKAGPNSDWAPAGKFFSGAIGPSGDFAFDGVKDAPTTADTFAWDASVAHSPTTTYGGANRANGAFYYKYPSEAEVKGILGKDRLGNNINQTQADANKLLYKGKWPDGALPDSFPAAILGGEDGISDTEWTGFVANNAGAISNTTTQTASDNEPRVYGVRRPTSARVGTDIPWSYNPIVANGITDTGGTLSVANAIANPSGYRRFWITQALASPNNRDFLPTVPAADARLFNLNAQASGSFENNFYVNYSSANILSLAWCNKQSAIAPITTAVGNLQRCGRSAYTSLPTFATLANGLQSVSLTETSTVWFPQTSNSALTDLANGTNSLRQGYFDGNLIIDAGTLSNATKPLVISGTITVNGDLVIRGKIRGSGRIVARGNVYIVGDLVYACTAAGGLCSRADYASGNGLPRLALLAGGNIVVGDYDAPDSRLNNLNRASDLQNDQTGRNQVPNANVRWDYFNVPGSTGRAPRDGNSDQFATFNTTTNQLNSASPQVTGNPAVPRVNYSGHAGFMTRVSNLPNGRTISSQKVVYKLSPFGYMLANANNLSAPETYESGTGFVNGAVSGSINVLSRTVSSVYPSNGPLLIGEASTRAANVKGFVAGSNGVPCLTTSSLLPARRYVFSPIASGLTANPNNNIPAAPFQFGYWCAPTTLPVGSYVRRDGGSASNTNNPSANATAWMQVNTQDSALDNNNGLTTGWLGGTLTDSAGTAVLGDLSQTRLLKLMWLSGMENTGSRTQGPLRTDGILYSPNSIVNLLRSGLDGRATFAGAGQSTTQSRWVHIGSVIASELGFLTTASSGNNTTSMNFTVNRTTPIDFTAATGSPNGDSAGSWGSGLSILYDNRLQGLLQITTGAGVKIRRTGVYAQVGIAR